MSGMPRLWRTLSFGLAAVLAAGVAFALLRAPLARTLALRHFSQAIAARDDSSARAALRATLDLDPLHPSARRLLAELYLRERLVGEAFLELQAQVDAFPGDSAAFIGLAEARSQASQFAPAEAALNSALDLMPDRTDLRRRRAELRALLGRYRSARIDAEAAARAGLNVAPLLADIDARVRTPCVPPAAAASAGDAESWPGELGGEIRDFARALRGRDWSRVASALSAARERHPGTMLAPWMEGLANLSFGDLQGAEKSFRRALEISPRSHRPITNLLAVWSRREGPLRAADELMKIVERDPQFAYPLPIAASAYIEADQPARAEQVVRRLFQVMPDAPQPYVEVARFLLQLDRPSDAIATAADGLARFPRAADLFIEQARAYAALGDRNGALRAYRSALEVRPDDQQAAAQLALLLARRSDLESREDALRIVRELECDAPADAEVLGAIGLVLLQAGGDPAAARTWLEAARNRAPESPHLRYWLALAYARSRDVSDASRELTQVLASGLHFEEEPDARRLLEEIRVGP